MSTPQAEIPVGSATYPDKLPTHREKINLPEAKRRLKVAKITHDHFTAQVNQTAKHYGMTRRSRQRVNEVLNGHVTSGPLFRYAIETLEDLLKVEIVADTDGHGK